MQHHSLTLKSNKISLDVIPLPSEGRPENFSGAIGEFKIDAMALPQKYSLGDPLTLVLTIEGEGNIKAISMPQLTGTEGWKIYPSTDRMEESDFKDVRGVKTFETSMIAHEPKTKTPGSLFSYFNPNTGKYVNVSTKPQPLEIIPSSPAVPSTAASASTTPSPSLSPPVATTPSLKHQALQSWKPLLYRSEYLILSGALLCALLLFTVYFGLQWYRKTESLLQQQIVKKLWLELQDERVAPELFFHKAAEYAQALLKKDSSLYSQFEEIFKRRDEMNYGAREKILRDQERQRILEKLTTANKS